jgi:hypothetical protein
VPGGLLNGMIRMLGDQRFLLINPSFPALQFE